MRVATIALAMVCVVACGSTPNPVTAQVSAPTEPATANTSTAEPAQPTLAPTSAPASPPTLAPTDVPTSAPGAQPISTPTNLPTPAPADAPTLAPVAQAASVAPAMDASAPDQTTSDSSPDASQLANCDVTARPDPLPVPGSPNAQSFFRSFRIPLPPAPLYDPPGPKRVGLQAGHWLTDQVPAELGRLQGGAVGGGKQEWEVNLDVAQRVAALLEANGVQVDVLPATIPPHYQANAFVALHADGDTTGQNRGFKVTRPGFSSLPDFDDRLVAAINQTYGAETELPRDDAHISLRMTYYYAFNSRRYCHSVAPGVPQAIIELAYLTSSTDRQWLIGDPQRLAQALADSINAFLATEP